LGKLEVQIRRLSNKIITKNFTQKDNILLT
jgi:hypothetical protein